MARPALSAARAVAVCNFLASHPDEGFTLSDLVRRLKINVASMHAILAVLSRAGYVTRADDGRYTIGPMLVPLGHAALHRHGTIVSARREVAALATELGVTGLVVGATGAEMVILDEVGTNRRGASSVGQRIEMVAPMGGVFVAWADEERVATWIATAPEAIREPREQALLHTWLDAIRRRGYAVGLETPARVELRRAVRELRDEPGSRRAKGRLRSNVARLGDIATVLLEPDPRDVYDVAHVAAPVPVGDGADLSIYLLGFRQPLGAAEVERIGERVRDAARRASDAASVTTPDARDDGAAATLLW